MDRILLLTSTLLVSRTGVFAAQLSKDNVGTVLFTASDSLRKCWSDEDLAMLTSRMFFEDILPCDLVFNIENDNFILSLIEYFRLVVALVKNSAAGKTKHVLLLALSDCLGGYLHHTALPLARHAFYSGNIKYDSVEKIYELYDELKMFLRTDGKTWAPPIINFQKYKNIIKPIPLIADEGGNHPCEEIIYYENTRDSEDIHIPMPFFDSRTRPHSIAVPFRNFSLRNIQDKSAAFILVKFYMTSVQCMRMKNVEKHSMLKFYEQFDTWIEREVVPHLRDDKFYAAFGGIYRVQQSLTKAEDTCDQVKKEIGSYEIMQSDSRATPKPGFEPLAEKRIFKRDENSGFEEYASFLDAGPQKRDVYEPECTKATLFFFWDEDHTKSLIVVLSLLTVLLLWFCIGTIYLCYRMRKKKGMEYVRSATACQQRPTVVQADSCGKEMRNIYPPMRHGVENKDVTVLYPPPYSNKSMKNLKTDRKKRFSGGLLMSSSGHTFRSNKPADAALPCTEKLHKNIGFPGPAHKARPSKKKPFVYGYDYRTSSQDTSPGSKSTTTSMSTPECRAPAKLRAVRERRSPSQPSRTSCMPNEAATACSRTQRSNRRSKKSSRKLTKRVQ